MTKILKSWRKSCPKCGQVIMKDIEISGGFVELIFGFKCPNCQASIQGVVTQKVIVTLKILVIVACLAIVGGFVRHEQSEATAGRIERQACRNFKTQEEAQRIYNRLIRDPYYGKFVAGLDGDNNGKVCEHLPHENGV